MFGRLGDVALALLKKGCHRGCQVSESHIYGALLPMTSTGIRVTLVRPTSDVEKEKTMNASDLRDKTVDQLKEELENLKKESFNLRFQSATGQMENTARVRQVKRTTARVLTILNEKAAAAAAE